MYSDLQSRWPADSETVPASDTSWGGSQACFKSVFGPLLLNGAAGIQVRKNRNPLPVAGIAGNVPLENCLWQPPGDAQFEGLPSTAAERLGVSPLEGSNSVSISAKTDSRSGTPTPTLSRSPSATPLWRSTSPLTCRAHRLSRSRSLRSSKGVVKQSMHCRSPRNMPLQPTFSS